MIVIIELDEYDLKALVKAEIERRLGDIKFNPLQLTIEAKSVKNYKAEWEQAKFRAVYRSLS